jgi:hypothetical protein
LGYESNIRDCLYNWLGYGNLNGQIWFIGTEEGGAEIWRQSTKTLEDSLHIRSEFKLNMDFRSVWEDLYSIPLEQFRGPCVWRYMAAFLLSMEGIAITSEIINKYIFIDKQLGINDSNHFMCELLPLPKRCKNDISDYKKIWNSISDYHKEVIPRRFTLIQETLTKNQDVKFVISYEHLLTKQILEYFQGNVRILNEWNYKSEQYVQYEINVGDNRQVVFLATPFFGNGRISYEGIKLASQNLLKSC